MLVDAAASGKPSHARLSGRMIAFPIRHFGQFENKLNVRSTPVKHNTISLRRRRLMIAGLAGATAPATVFAAQRSSALAAPLSSASRYASDGTLVLSGRILGADRRPVNGASIEILAVGLAPRAAATTDADGRFVLTTHACSLRDGCLQALGYRITHRAHRALEARVDFARAQSQQDEAGVWRAAVGLAFA
jgi:hypothetical protein